MNMRRWMPLLCVPLLLASPSADLEAKPPAPQEFCNIYPQAPVCASGQTECTTCHSVAPALNVYGESISEVLAPGEARPLSDATFVTHLRAALEQIEAQDADGDGATNIDEITFGTSPSDATILPMESPSECRDGVKGVPYDVCAYDAAYVFKKLHLDFCGYSPTLDERRAFAAEPDAQQALSAALDRCLDTEYWRGKDGVVWNLGNEKIAPIQAIKAGEGEGPIPLADYFDDYNFFVFANTDGQDVRDLLIGRYFVSRTDALGGGPTEYKKYSRDPRLTAGDYESAQLISAGPRRAGLLTHRWFLMSMIMFTSVPRTAAAQAYRAYLGKDISRLEGLVAIPDEPKDYDNKGVKDPACSGCHATLDPLTYPFSTYEGIGGGSGNIGSDYLPFSYNPGRVERFVSVDGPGVADVPEAGYILGQPVNDLVEWAEVAANSDEFAQKVVLDYWALLHGEPPRGSEQQEYEQLWRDLKQKNEYSVEAMLHDLIKTEAYGVP